MVENAADPMNGERFEALVAAYGGDIGRWPQTERAAAREFAQSPTAAKALAGAADLDALLDTYVVKSGSAGLENRIDALLVRRLTIRNWFRFGSAGLGLMGIGIAGAIAGNLAIAVLAPALTTADTSVVSDGTATIFGDIGPDTSVVQDSQ
ncbi:MAG: hypothetical protein E6Q76_09800 [Rhizobium sp.]|nr:MAG: hypothetical protein E6Q76_09800 [Rhizobium sp.]